MKNILVPTDFSVNADTALYYASKLATKAKAEVTVMHVCELYEEKYSKYKSLINEYNQSLITELYKKLNDAKDLIERDNDIKATVCLYKNGDVTTCILQAAKDYKADLIVMGSHGMTGLRRKFFGSKAAEVINKSIIPIITTPPAYKWSPPIRIALALSDSLQQTEIVKPVFELAELFGGSVSFAAFSKESEDYEMLTRTKTAHLVQQRLKSTYKNVKVNFVQLVGTNFQETLQQFISEKKIDILVMITKEKSFFQNIFNGSETQNMSYYLTVPLLSLHHER